ncbi:pterin-4-alpha-carbinolamine dehydratase 2, mitochondrial [Cicer arietinum]|uniref:4a-hydroxytetrahydrobiopterin dehydratase n=1 Tax=Cicer arietinum TaxID=3827 RepID=A0A1S2YYQ4_CICAR|nr:pterin-4-alpha-carbinolamine dehydratase 2, mitochondrial [Cicer arietinum]
MRRVNAMNRILLLIRHPLSVSKPTLLPLPFFLQSNRTRLIMDSNNIQNNQLPVSSLTTTFCTSHKDLSKKTCVPCNSKDLQPMTEDAARTLIPQVSEWNLVNEGGSLKLSRSWKVKSFNKGLEFFRLIADLAEAEGHHPDLHLVGWNNVTIEIWTHSAGGLTENDFILAAKINELNVHSLLRRKASD